MYNNKILHRLMLPGAHVYLHRRSPASRKKVHQMSPIEVGLMVSIYRTPKHDHKSSIVMTLMQEVRTDRTQENHR